MDRSRYVSQQVWRISNILKAVTDSREPMSVSEIMTACELSMDIAFRTCVALWEVGFLSRVGDRYELGMANALFWAKKKATLESQRERIDKAIETLGI